jgi:hypothetical protein
MNIHFADGLRRERRRVTSVLVALLFANLVACTEYVPVRGAVDAANAPEVRVTLTDQGTVDVASRLGLRAKSLEGVLGSMSDSSLALTVRKVSREDGIEDSYAGEQISLSPRDFDAVAQGRTSVPRTLLLAGAIVAGALLAARGASDLSGGKTGGPPPPTR